MTNVTDTHKTRSIGNNTDLAPIASDSERILRIAYPPSQMASEISDMGHNTHDQVKKLEQALKSNDEGPLFSATFEQAPHTDQSVPYHLASSEILVVMRLMTQEEAKSIYASQVSASMTKVAEEVLLDIFQVGFDLANAWLENSSYHFVEIVLMEKAQKGALEGVFDRSIKR